MAGEDNHDVGGIPPWVQFIRGDLTAMENRLNGRLERMVSTDLFVAEQTRVDGRFKDQADDITSARTDAAAALTQVGLEREARLRAEADYQRLENERQKEKAEQVGRNRWTVLGWVASPVIAIVLAFVVAGGLVTPR